MSELNVGQKIRAVREQRGLSLRALADKCGLSFNAISRIEHGENSPTVATLHALAKALEVPITTFFEETHEQSVIFVKQATRVRTLSHGLTIDSLGAGLRNQEMEPFLVSMEPGTRSHETPITHAGEEFVYCLTGSIEYQIEDSIYELVAGDSLLLDATQPHCFANKTDAPAQFIIIFQGAGHRESIERHQG